MKFASLTMAVLFVIPVCQAQKAEPKFRPVIPKMWDDAEMAKLELPLANPAGSPKHVTSDYYYRIPVRPIYKQYALYPDGAGPAGYFEWLRQQEPEIVWGEDQDGRKHAPPLENEADWIKAGEMVFDAAIGYRPWNDQLLRFLRDLHHENAPPTGERRNDTLCPLRHPRKGKARDWRWLLRRMPHPLDAGWSDFEGCPEQ